MTRDAAPAGEEPGAERHRARGESSSFPSPRAPEFAGAFGTEETRRQSEEWLRLATTAARMYLWEVDLDTQKVKRVGATVDSFGFTPPEGYEAAMALYHPDDAPRIRDEFSRAVGRGGPFDLEGRIVNPATGEVFWRRVVGTVLQDAAGRAVRAIGVAQNVTDRKKAENALRASDERYRTLFESIDEGFCVIEVLFDAADRASDYRFLEINPAFERHTGIANAVGRTMREIAPGHEEHWFRIYGRVAQTGEPVRFVEEARRLGGRWFDVYAFRLGDPEVRHVAVLFQDITEKQHALHALENLNRTLERRVEEGTRETRRLASRLTMAEQEERRRVSHVLHDDVQQHLYGVRLKATRMRDIAAGVRNGDLGREIRDLCTLLDGALEVTRRLTVDLSPPVLQSAKLDEMLGWLRSQMLDMHGLEVAVLFEGAIGAVNEDIRVLLFQTIRELLFNVVKHAGVGTARIEIRQKGGFVFAAVIDEGRGFNIDGGSAGERHGRGLGLSHVRERLGLVGGGVTIESAPERGVRVTVHAPIQPLW